MPEVAGVAQTRLLVVRQLAARTAHFDAAMKEVTAAETRLAELPGVGAVVAARLHGELGCPPRVRSAAALAGVAPLAVAVLAVSSVRAWILALAARLGRPALRTGWSNWPAPPADTRSL